MLFYLKFMFVFILFGFHSRLVVLFESKSREGQNRAEQSYARARHNYVRAKLCSAALCILTLQ